MRPIRIKAKGLIYHTTTRCNNREFYIKDDHNFQSYLAILLKAKIKHQVEIYGYILTNNHVHLLVATPYNNDLSKFMQYVNGNYARSYNRNHGRRTRFWEERFNSTIIESETQFFNTLFYIESNMVRNGATNKLEEWKWSSYHCHKSGKSNGIVDFHPLYLALANDASKRAQIFCQIAEQSLREKGFAKQPQITFGIILGSSSFVESLIENNAKNIAYYQKRKLFSKNNSFFIRKS